MLNGWVFVSSPLKETRSPEREEGSIVNVWVDVELVGVQVSHGGREGVRV